MVKTYRAFLRSLARWHDRRAQSLRKREKLLTPKRGPNKTKLTVVDRRGAA